MRALPHFRVMLVTRRLTLIAAVALAALVGARASATPTIPTVHATAERPLTVGVTGADAQFALSPAAAAPWGAKAHAVNAEIVRLEILWATVAPAHRPAHFNAADPTSPGYDWSTLDQKVKNVTRDGFKVILTIYDAPRWAEPARIPSYAAAGAYEPSPADLSQFATAVATRYDGHTDGLPRVSYFEPWNEPNLSGFLAPQWVRAATGLTAESPTLYRAMNNAVYAAVKAVSNTNRVVTAGLAPFGDPPGQGRMQPVTFAEALFGLNRQNRRVGTRHPVELDGLDEHPYPAGQCCQGPTVGALSPDDVDPADYHRLATILGAAERAGTALPAGHKSLWATEIGWETTPPYPSHSGYASPTGQVGLWAEQALYVLWAQGVSDVFWYELADQVEAPEGWLATYAEGLYFADGRAKPTATAFGFPFITLRRTAAQLTGWGRAPSAGTVVVQRRTAAGWTPLLQFSVAAREVFEVPIPLTGAGTLRATLNDSTSLAWPQAG